MSQYNFSPPPIKDLQSTTDLEQRLSNIKNPQIGVKPFIFGGPTVLAPWDEDNQIDEFIKSSGLSNYANIIKPALKGRGYDSARWGTITEQLLRPEVAKIKLGTQQLNQVQAQTFGAQNALFGFGREQQQDQFKFQGQEGERNRANDLALARLQLEGNTNATLGAARITSEAGIKQAEIGANSGFKIADLQGRYGIQQTQLAGDLAYRGQELDSRTRLGIAGIESGDRQLDIRTRSGDNRATLRSEEMREMARLKAGARTNAVQAGLGAFNIGAQAVANTQFGRNFGR